VFHDTACSALQVRCFSSLELLLALNALPQQLAALQVSPAVLHLARLVQDWHYQAMHGWRWPPTALWQHSMSWPCQQAPHSTEVCVGLLCTSTEWQLCHTYAHCTRG